MPTHHDNLPPTPAPGAQSQDYEYPSQGLYIHIPFCRSRCIYCDFYSTTGKLQLQDAYTGALIHEMRLRQWELDQPFLDTIYIGGGTPTLMSMDNLAALLETASTLWLLSPTAEITVEANPDDINTTVARSLKQMGVNRVSLGAQTFDDDKLRFLHRRHNSAQVFEAVWSLHDAGIDNISIDLIYGLPNQTLAQWEDDVEKALSLPVTHLSAYALTYEYGTPLRNLKRKGIVQEVDDETQYRMYQRLIDITREKGFWHYELSNFCKPHLRAQHNSGYWRRMRYVGLGPAAHSFDGRARRWNKAHLMLYLNFNGDTTEKWPQLHTNPGHPDDHYLYECELLSEAQQKEEMLLTSLRTAHGLILGEYTDAFGPDATMSLLDRAKPYMLDESIIFEPYPQLTFPERQLPVEEIIESAEQHTPYTAHVHDGFITYDNARPTLCLARKALFRSDGIISSLFED